MSNRHRDELIMVAKRAAVEATSSERARCLWVLNRLLQQCAKDVDSKILPAAQVQLAKVRFELTRAIVKAASTLIVSGARPPVATATPAKAGDPPSPPSEIIVP